MSKHTLHAWQRKFELEGPTGLMDQPRGQMDNRSAFHAEEMCAFGEKPA
jgi:hypothetical protein